MAGEMDANIDVVVDAQRSGVYFESETLLC
jgi:hypothetical protein